MKWLLKSETVYWATLASLMTALIAPYETVVFTVSVVSLISGCLILFTRAIFGE